MADALKDALQHAASIVEASINQPLSVIIVGVGPSDFVKMEVLDADLNPLIDSDGRQAARDIV